MRSHGSRSLAAAAVVVAGVFITAPAFAQRVAPGDVATTPEADRPTPPADTPAEPTVRVDRSDTQFSGLAPAQRRQIQETLQSRGFYQGAIDGLYGPATRQALSAYQRVEGLEVTGHADRATRRQMGITSDEVQPVRGISDEPRAGTETPTPIGARGPTVRLAQEVLAREGFHRGHIDGLLGPTTARSIRAFQESRGLAVTGDLTPDTLRALGLPEVAEETTRVTQAAPDPATPAPRRSNAPDAETPPPAGVPQGR